ncbi:hypothetical protein D3C85_1299090 [compost metagenome]
MHQDAPVPGQLRRVIRADGAAGVVAVGEQDQDLFPLPGRVEQLDGEPDGATQGRVRAGHADADLVQQHQQAGVVERERRLGIGTGAEHDQADAVILAPADEVTHHVLHHAEAVDPATAGVGVVAGFHGLGDVDGEHQVAYRLLVLDRLLDEHRTGAGRRQQRPDQQVQRQLPAPSPGADGARRAAHGPAHGRKERHPQCAAGFAVLTQVAVRHPGQRQEQQHPGVIKPPHGGS